MIMYVRLGVGREDLFRLGDGVLQLEEGLCAALLYYVCMCCFV